MMEEGAVEENDEEEMIENIEIEQVVIVNEEDGPLDENANHASHHRRDIAGRKVLVD